jgi:hypothetical protein
MSEGMSCTEQIPGEYLVECYYDMLVFKITMYSNIIFPCIFFAWIIFVLVKTRCKVDRIGLLMFAATIIQQAI